MLRAAHSPDSGFPQGGCYTLVVSASDEIVVFGAGSLGTRVARAVNPVLFCDNNQNLWGTSVEGVPVESPVTAINHYPGATFVAAIWNPSPTESMLDRIGQLKRLGASRVIPFTDVLEEYGDRILPNLLWAKSDFYAAHADEIREARSLLTESGREEFDRQMRLRSGKFDGQVIDQGIQYFPPEITLGDHEVFVDCGAYDGDTVAQFRKATGDRFERIMAFEPNPFKLPLLREATQGDRRISIQPYGVGNRRETVRFTDAGVGSRISADGGCEVQIVTLDEALQGMAPTYMKFDIEGSELDALEGGQGMIRRHRPKLAVCVYHVPDHLWRIPLKLHELVPDATFTMRTYSADGFECVCYCIPN